jgi:hypothetical protein
MIGKEKLLSDILTIIGVLLSLIGAGISIYQAYKSSQSKNEAEKVKDYLIEKFDNYENSQLRSEIRNANQIISDIKSRSLYNETSERDMGKIELLLTTIMSQKIYETGKVKESIDNCHKLLQKITNDNFKTVLSRINSQLANVSREIDKTIRSQ